jgi:hypothetical protein
MTIKIECFFRGKLIETQLAVIGMRELKYFCGPGVSNKTIMDLKRKGKSETLMDSGRKFVYTVVE